LPPAKNKSSVNHHSKSSNKKAADRGARAAHCGPRR
jgi:hypothetical protein